MTTEGRQQAGSRTPTPGFAKEKEAGASDTPTTHQHIIQPAPREHHLMIKQASIVVVHVPQEDAAPPSFEIPS